MQIHKIHSGDLNDIASTNELQPFGWSDIAKNFEHYVSADFCFPLKVVIDGKIVGIGATIIHGDVAWLAHIIVHANHRNKGIGKYITQALIASREAKKCTTFYLCATDLGTPVYQRLGFVTEAEYLFFANVTIDTGRDVPKNIVSFREDLRMQLVALDRKASGEDRMRTLENHLPNGYVYLNKSVVTGFYLPTYGDGLIVAKSSVGGLELMKFRLRTNRTAAFPADNLIALAFMLQNEHSVIKKEKRMRLGVNRALNLSYIYNRSAGKTG